MSRFIVKTVDIVFLILLTVMIFTMGMTLFGYIMSNGVAFIVGAVLIFGLTALLFFTRERIRKLGVKIYARLKDVPAYKLALYLFLFTAITKIIFVFLLGTDASLHVDFGKYRLYAEEFATNGRITESTAYALRYPYTVMYGLVMSPFAKLFGGDTRVFTTALSVMNALAMVLLFDILKRYVGKEKAFVFTMLYGALPNGLFQTQLFTHENGLFFFHILALWIFLKAFDKKNHIVLQFVYVLLSSALLGIGKSINAAGRVFFIAFGIYAVTKIFEGGIDRKKLTRVACVFLVLVLMFVGASKLTDHIAKSYIDGADTYQKSDKRLPYGWALYLGMNYEYNGLWNLEDLRTYELYNEIEDKEESLRYQKGLISDRLNEYLNAPYKIPVHLFKKIGVLWGDQTLPFGYVIGNEVSTFIWTFGNGIIFGTIACVNRVSYMIVYIMLLLSILGKRKEAIDKVTPETYFKMAIIGVTLALLLFEVTAKYASHLQVFFFCLLAMYWNGMYNLKNPFAGNKS